MGLSAAIPGFYNWWNGVNKIKSPLKKDDNPLRVGVLSAAAINYMAIIDPIQTHPGVILSGIASRQLSKAQAQIDENKLGPTCKAYGSYDELLADPDIDAVYVPLPNGLHCEWAIRAMEAGKHVLIEKPITSNADEARQVREAAAKTNKVALEAFHWRFHPAAHRVKSIIESGEYGSVTSIYARLLLPAGTVGRDDIRLKYGLGGGACMDLTYVFSSCCYFASSNITKCNFDVSEATPRIHKGDNKIDEAMESKFVIKQEGKPPTKCHVQADLVMSNLLGIIPKLWLFSPIATIELDKAKIEFNNFVVPGYFHSITITEKDDQGRVTAQRTTEKCYKGGPLWASKGEDWWTTYRYQLEAFVSMVRAKAAGTNYDGPSMTLDESEKLMQLIDKVYDKAELPRRGT